MEELWLERSLDRQWCIDVANGRHHRCLFHGLNEGPLVEVTGLSSRIFGLDTLRRWRLWHLWWIGVTFVIGSPFSRARAEAALPPPEPPTGGGTRRNPPIDAVGIAAGGKFRNGI